MPSIKNTKPQKGFLYHLKIINFFTHSIRIRINFRNVSIIFRQFVRKNIRQTRIYFYKPLDRPKSYRVK